MKGRFNFKSRSGAYGLIAAAIGIFQASASAQNYRIERFAFEAISGHSADDVLSIRGKIGTTKEKTMVAGNFLMRGKFVNLGIAPPSAPAGELIVNGSFENIGGTFVNQSGGIMSLLPDSEVIPGWTAKTEEVAWLSNGAAGLVSPFGDYFIDLTGYRYLAPYGGLSQSIATVPHRRYRLSLALGASTFSSQFRSPVSVQVTAGSASSVLTFETAEVGIQWGTLTWDFVANSPSTLITITGNQSKGGHYIGLDNVSVTLAPPALEISVSTVDVLRGELHLSFRGKPGRNYTIESAPDLAADGWGAIPEVLKIGADETYEAVIPMTKPRQFYRLREVP